MRKISLQWRLTVITALLIAGDMYFPEFPVVQERNILY